MSNDRPPISTLLRRAPLAVCLILCVSSRASDDPLVLRNLSPLYANLGIPVMASAGLPAAGSWGGDLQIQVASHALRERGAQSRLELDGETRRLDLALAYSPSARLRLRANIPWINHDGGQLDALIDGWHEVFGLPDGSRDDQPQDRLRFDYDGPGGQWLLSDGSSALGDIELAADLALFRSEYSSITGFTSIKLPSGDEDDFTGSGETAVAAGMRLYRAQCGFERLSCHLQLGVADIGDSPLDTRADSWAPFYGLSLAWAVLDRLTLLAQVEGQSVVYQSAPLDAPGAPVLGALGLRWQAAERWEVEAMFSEDLNVGAAPDITFQLGIRHGW